MLCSLPIVNQKPEKPPPDTHTVSFVEDDAVKVEADDGSSCDPDPVFGTNESDEMTDNMTARQSSNRVLHDRDGGCPADGLSSNAISSVIARPAFTTPIGSVIVVPCKLGCSWSNCTVMLALACATFTGPSSPDTETDRCRAILVVLVVLADVVVVP